MDDDASVGSEEHLHWADELIDEEIKSLLAVKSNGSQIPLDLIAHFEYFYNTLDCQFKPENPFEKPKHHPALLYVDQTTSMTNSPIKAMTLLEKHRHVIFPNSETATQTRRTISESNSSAFQTSSNLSPTFGETTENQESSGTTPSQLSALLLPKQYKWYPNETIHTPMSGISCSPGPKQVSKNIRRGSAAITNNPYQRVSSVFQQN